MLSTLKIKLRRRVASRLHNYYRLENSMKLFQLYLSYKLENCDKESNFVVVLKLLGSFVIGFQQKKKNSNGLGQHCFYIHFKRFWLKNCKILWGQGASFLFVVLLAVLKCQSFQSEFSFFSHLLLDKVVRLTSK